MRNAVGAVLWTVLSTGWALPAGASDWVMITGTEEGRPGAVTPWGFAELLIESRPSSGRKQPWTAGAAQSGATSGNDDVVLSLRRARLGARGLVPHTSRRLAFVIDVEAGQNGMTRDRGIVVADASLSWKVMSGLRLRIGQFKLPLADEAIESNVTAASFTRFSPMVAGLLLEDRIQDGALFGPSASFRDVGMQAFDAVSVAAPFRGAIVVTYATMLSLGRPAHAFADIDDATSHAAHLAARGPDVSGRVQLSWVFDEKTQMNANREELSMWVWGLTGSRENQSLPIRRTRMGAGGLLRLAGLRLRGEAAYGQGALFDAHGDNWLLYPNATGWGANVELAVERLGALRLAPFAVDVLAGALHRDAGNNTPAHDVRALALGGELNLSSHLRILMNAELRREDPRARARAQGLTALHPLFSAQLNLIL